MSKVRINFTMGEDIGHQVDVSLVDESLLIKRHQETVFKGTIQGFKAAISRIDVKHSMAGQYKLYYSKILEIIDDLRVVLLKAEPSVKHTVRK